MGGNVSKFARIVTMAVQSIASARLSPGQIRRPKPKTMDFGSGGGGGEDGGEMELVIVWGCGGVLDMSVGLEEQTRGMKRSGLKTSGSK